MHKSYVVNDQNGEAGWPKWQSLEMSTTMQGDPGSNPGRGKKCIDGICKYLPRLSLSYVINYNYVLIKLRHCVGYTGASIKPALLCFVLLCLWPASLSWFFRVQIVTVRFSGLPTIVIKPSVVVIIIIYNNNNYYYLITLLLYTAKFPPLSIAHLRHQHRLTQGNLTFRLTYQVRPHLH